MSRPVTGPSVTRRARWSAQMRPYSAQVVIRTQKGYGGGRAEGSLRSPAPRAGPPSARGHHPVRATRHADLRHLAQVEHLVDLPLREERVAAHHVADQHPLLHRLLAQLRGTRVADV